MMKKIIFLMGLIGGLQGLHAQRNIITHLQTEKPGQGKVAIHQDEAIAKLVSGTNSAIDFGEPAIKNIAQGTPEVRRTIKAKGYRIQVYAGNNSRRAKNEAMSIASRIREEFPEIQVYTYFLSPRWLCRVGDFKSIEEADEMLRRLKKEGGYREVSIVKEQINLPID